MILEEQDGDPLAHTVDLDDAALSAPEALASEVTAGDMLIYVSWSAINYEDGLAITGKGPVVHKWPMVAGIDGAGAVLDPLHPDWWMGNAVVLNGWGVGEARWGCLAQQARFSGDWLVALPTGLDAWQTVAIGTASYTAMLSVLALERTGIRPGDGEVLMADAPGGVDSIAIALFGKLGYRVVASTGKVNEADFLQVLGAREAINRAKLSAPDRPLQKERQATVVDSVSSYTLVSTYTRVRYGGMVTVCGLVQGMDFPATVAPFILRGMTLYGVDSVMASRALRRIAWQRLTADLLSDRLVAITREVTLSKAIDATHDIMAGKMRGRVVVDVSR